jgi:hypothetical protein
VCSDKHTNTQKRVHARTHRCSHTHTDPRKAGEPSLLLKPPRAKLLSCSGERSLRAQQTEMNEKRGSFPRNIAECARLIPRRRPAGDSHQVWAFKHQTLVLVLSGEHALSSFGCLHASHTHGHMPPDKSRSPRCVHVITVSGTPHAKSHKHCRMLG